ncbi:hypothetical protein ACRAQ6_01065 [Erythrobacter sp. HA6-11]
MIKTFAVATGLILTGIATPALANDGPRSEVRERANERIDNRQDRQRSRIGNGARSGDLTGRETSRLVRQQANIRQFERQSRRDGPGITPRERVRIENMQDRASRNIFRARNNNRSRP